MEKRVQYKTEAGVLISSTDHPTYATRKRAARKAKEQGHSTLVEYHRAQERTYNLSNYIQS